MVLPRMSSTSNILCYNEEEDVTFCFHIPPSESDHTPLSTMLLYFHQPL